VALAPSSTLTLVHVEYCRQQAHRHGDTLPSASLSSFSTSWRRRRCCDHSGTGERPNTLSVLLAGIEKRHHAAPAKEPLFRRKAQASCCVGVTHLHRTTAKLRQWPPPASILLRPRLRRMYSIPVIAGMMDSQNQRAPSKGTAQEA